MDRPLPALARPASRRFRLTRAYAAAVRVALSYLVFEAVAWVRGAGWAQRRRTALHRRNGRRIRRSILRLRGLFVKVGQLASVLTNFLPEALRDELEGLQDAVPAGPYESVRQRVVAELGAEPDALFATFDRAPVASASLAQVHRATLPDGRAVAVKVQHADIEAIARLDLRAIRTILRVVGRWFGVRGLRQQFDEIEAVVLGELDFEQEAAALDAFRATLTSRDRVSVPALVPERSARRVLTTAFVEGVKAGDLPALDRLGIDRAELAERIVTAYGQMIFSDGLYHADPHPGNLIVQPDGTLVFLDFGATARLTPEMRRGLAEFLMAVLQRDAPRTTRALGTMGFIPEGEGTEAVVELLERIHDRVLQGIDPDTFRFADVTARTAMAGKMEAFGDMRDLGVSFRDLAGTFRVPRDWILLERTALLILGLCTSLAPDLNPFRLLWPYVSPLVEESAPPGGAVRDTAVRALRAALALPLTARRVLDTLDRGEATVRVAGLPAAAALVYAGLRQLTFAIVGAGSGTVAYLAWADGAAALATGLGGLAGVCGLALVVSALRVRRHRVHA